MQLFDWLRDRTGLGALPRAATEPRTAGKPVARCGWISAIVLLFALQLVTGVLLMTVYTPSTAAAWGSVWYIQTQLPFGWLIRGVHAVATDAMVIVLVGYLGRLILSRSYRRPHEFIWWIALVLLGVVVFIAQTGYLLPFDQPGYWGTAVRMNILAIAPLIGDTMKRVLLGGESLGQSALTRFHVLHVLVLPVIMALLLRARRAVIRRHPPAEPSASGDDDSRYRHESRVRQALVRLTLLLMVVAVVWIARSESNATWLHAPADPASANYPARPEWYFLFLFQWLKHFQGPAMEVIGAILLPTIAAVLLFAVPLFELIVAPRRAHRVVVLLCAFLLSSFAWLTYAAVRADRDPRDELVLALEGKQRRGEPLLETEQDVLDARALHQRRVQATRFATRAFELASQHGIPPEGPLVLLADDPQTRGPALFAAHCASCHRYHGHDGLGIVPAECPTSSDLGDYASRDWIRGLLADPMAPRYFGLMVTPDGAPAHTKMAKWIEDTLEENESPADRRMLFENFDAVAAYLADESVSPGRLASLTSDNARTSDDTGVWADDASESRRLLRGRRFFIEVCNECHSYSGQRNGTRKAPEMFGYGSVEWLEQMIADPRHETRYRSVGREPARMPSFQDRLREHDRSLIARWLHSSRCVHPAPE